MTDPWIDRPAAKINVHTVTTLTPNLFKGFLMAMLGLFLLSCMDSATKYLIAHYNVPFVVAIRYIVHFLLMVLLFAPRHSTQLIKTQRTGLVILRALVLTLSSVFMGLALQRMPLAETVAINFLAPTLVAFLATYTLHERIDALNWAAIITGFIGVLVIARPGGGLDTIGVMFALCAASAGAAYQILSRLLASTEKAITLLFYVALVGSILSAIALPWFWENKMPSNLELVLLISMGVSGGLGHYFFTRAYSYISASILAPITYLQLFWAGLMGWLIFDAVPDSLSILGMCIIVASGLLIALKFQRNKNSAS